jgi:hypothetical protein
MKTEKLKWQKNKKPKPAKKKSENQKNQTERFHDLHKTGITKKKGTIGGSPGGNPFARTLFSHARERCIGFA